MKLILIFIIIFLNLSVQAASLKETIFLSSAGATICKVYAEEVGGDVQAFSNMNVQITMIAEKMGYVDNLQSYLSEVFKIKKFLQNQLFKKHGSKLNVYNNWCTLLYDGYQKGLANR